MGTNTETLAERAPHDRRFRIGWEHLDKAQARKTSEVSAALKHLIHTESGLAKARSRMEDPTKPNDATFWAFWGAGFVDDARAKLAEIKAKPPTQRLQLEARVLGRHLTVPIPLFARRNTS